MNSEPKYISDRM